MKKLLVLAIALLVIGATGISAFADDNDTVGKQVKAQARIHKMGALGNGLAISQDDSMNFELLKIGIAAVKVGEEDTAAVKVGVLYLGEEKYRLKEVEIGNGSASANIYDADDEQVGSISLDSYPKGDKEIWAGEMELNDEDYNAYVIQAKRSVKTVEKAAHAFEYCKNNPDKCKAAMKAVGQILCDPETDENCRNRVKTFCEGNPEDNRCVSLRMAYCKQNLDDADCRAEFMERCKQNVNEEVCDKLGEVYNRAMQKRPEFMEKAPDWFKKASERIRERIENQTNNNTGNGNGNGNGNGGE